MAACVVGVAETLAVQVGAKVVRLVAGIAGVRKALAGRVCLALVSPEPVAFAKRLARAAPAETRTAATPPQKAPVRRRGLGQVSAGEAVNVAYAEAVRQRHPVRRPSSERARRFGTRARLAPPPAPPLRKVSGLAAYPSARREPKPVGLLRVVAAASQAGLTLFVGTEGELAPRRRRAFNARQAQDARLAVGRGAPFVVACEV